MATGCGSEKEATTARDEVRSRIESGAREAIATLPSEGGSAEANQYLREVQTLLSSAVDTSAWREADVHQFLSDLDEVRKRGGELAGGGADPEPVAIPAGAGQCNFCGGTVEPGASCSRKCSKERSCCLPESGCYN